jgi:putative effector of murein hydrolase
LSIDEFFGLVTIVTGVVGTAGGGLLLDRMCPTVRNGMAIGAASSALATALLALCFTVRACGALMNHVHTRPLSHHAQTVQHASYV